jgi:hypothetical protein
MGWPKRNDVKATKNQSFYAQLQLPDDLSVRNDLLASQGTVKHMFLNVDTVLKHMLSIQI